MPVQIDMYDVLGTAIIAKRQMSHGEDAFGEEFAVDVLNLLRGHPDADSNEQLHDELINLISFYVVDESYKERGLYTYEGPQPEEGSYDPETGQMH